MDSRTRILLKITGELFLDSKRSLSNQHLKPIIAQIKELSPTHQFSLVVGGGNFFRGNQHGKALELTPSVGHSIGMLGTMMNGLILKDLLEQSGLASTLFCALSCSHIGYSINQQGIDKALHDGHTLIFTGGTGNPFFTTDTNAVLRGLETRSQQVWKGTKVDGVYDQDPEKNPQAKLLKKVTFQEAIEEKFGIMDQNSYVLAAQNNLPIRVFNLFADNTLLQAVTDTQFGSIIS